MLWHYLGVGWHIILTLQSKCFDSENVSFRTNTECWQILLLKCLLDYVAFIPKDKVWPQKPWFLLALNRRERLGVLWSPLCVRGERSILSLWIFSWDCDLVSLNNRLQKVSQEKKLIEYQPPCSSELCAGSKQAWFAQYLHKLAWR